MLEYFGTAPSACELLPKIAFRKKLLAHHSPRACYYAPPHHDQHVVNLLSEMMRLARRALVAQQRQLARQQCAPRCDFSSHAPRVFASFGVYKPDHFEVTPIAPTYRALQGGAYALKSPGRILVSIAPHDGKAIEWNRKSKFGLSAVEAAQLIDVHNSVSPAFLPAVWCANYHAARLVLCVHAAPGLDAAPSSHTNVRPVAHSPKGLW